MQKSKIFIFILLIICISCCNKNKSLASKVNDNKNSIENDTIIKSGIYNIAEYINYIDGKKIAIVANQTSIINNTHLVDTLISLKQNVIKIFSPEHGFRGNADAGATIKNSIDEKTQLPLISLYGNNNKKPQNEHLKDVEILIFDLQDVGVRFYTYISTLHYVMEAAAENNIPMIVLDRPNPNAGYIDGMLLDTSKYKSFIGMHPVPVIYGMTIGEYALMINGEKWLKNQIQCNLKIVKCENYTHDKKYSLPVAPSPNLPNDRAIELYPTLCFFEGTNLSIGRGTDKQFQIIGHPQFKDVETANFSFTPKPNSGASNPDLNGKLCYGFDLSENNSIFVIENKLNILLIKKVYELFPDKSQFFKKTNFFELLSGNSEFRQQIIDDISEDVIRQTWQKDIDNFKKIRDKYLIYR